MPLPKPTFKENKKEFITRCISILADEDSGKRWPNNNQRIAICFKIWSDKINECSIDEIVEKYL